jgi:hypothetical protein
VLTVVLIQIIELLVRLPKRKDFMSDSAFGVFSLVLLERVNFINFVARLGFHLCRSSKSHVCWNQYHQRYQLLAILNGRSTVVIQ